MDPTVHRRSQYSIRFGGSGIGLMGARKTDEALRDLHSAPEPAI